MKCMLIRCNFCTEPVKKTEIYAFEVKVLPLFPMFKSFIQALNRTAALLAAFSVIFTYKVFIISVLGKQKS